MVSAAETLRRFTLVEELLLRGLSGQQIEAICKRQLNVGINGTRSLVARVRERWTQDAEDERPARKAAAIRRIHHLLLKAKQTDVKDSKTGIVTTTMASPEKWRWNAIVQLEKLLAEIEGTMEPLKIDVGLSLADAGMRVVRSMSPEEIEAAAAEYDENLRLAGKAKELGMGGEPSNGGSQGEVH